MIEHLLGKAVSMYSKIAKLGISENQNKINVNLKAKAIKKDSEDCTGCYFEAGGCCDCSNMQCCANERKDKRTIIWVPDEKPAKKGKK